MNNIKIRCKCGKTLSGPAEALETKTIKCPSCGASLGKTKKRKPTQRTPSAKAAASQKKATTSPTARKKKSTAKGGCPNCGAGLSKGAVLCVQCGFDLRSGKLVNAEPEPEPEEAVPEIKYRNTEKTETKKKKTKKKKKRTASDSSEPRWYQSKPIWAAAGGVALLAIIPIVLVETGSLGAGTYIGPTGKRPPQSTPSSNPTDWAKSFPAFTANFKVDPARDPKRPYAWQLTSSHVALPSADAAVVWEGYCRGRDWRHIGELGASGRTAFGFDFGKGSAIVEPIFVVNGDQVEALEKHSYRRVRIQGKLLHPKILWLDRDRMIIDTTTAPDVPAGQTVILERGGEAGGSHILCLLPIEITKIEALQ